MCDFAILTRLVKILRSRFLKFHFKIYSRDETQRFTWCRKMETKRAQCKRTAKQKTTRRKRAA